MDLTSILTGVGAILTAAGGCVLVIREFRRRDRRQFRRELNEYSSELHRCRELHVHWRHYAFELRQQIADLGGEPPSPPEPE